MCNLPGNRSQIDKDKEVKILTVLNNLDINDGPSTTDENIKIKKNLVDDELKSPDYIHSEVFTTCNIERTTLSLNNNLLKRGQKPECCSMLEILSFSKEESLDLHEHCRRMTLCPIATKMLKKLTFNDR